MEAILSEYTEFHEDYRATAAAVTKGVQGRICHHYVVVLQILVKLFPIRNYLEIGVHNGTSMSYVVHQTHRPLKCIGVDLFSDAPKRYAHDKLQMGRTQQTIDRMNISGSEIHLLKGNSQSATTHDSVRTALSGEQVDLLFIDGDHEFAGVESDFLMYSGLVRPGGFIVFDDANSQYPGILKCIEKHVENSAEFKIVGLFGNTDLIVRRV